MASFGDPSSPAFVQSLLIPSTPQAIICSNDLTAALLMQTLGMLGIRIPADLAIASFDDVRYATLLAVPLTTMRQPCRDLGVAAVETMLQRIAAPASPPRQVLLSAELIIRQSTTTKTR
jgi:LacI family transcriptional regulator